MTLSSDFKRLEFRYIEGYNKLDFYIKIDQIKSLQVTSNTKNLLQKLELEDSVMN